jgi:hypothetical protein
VGKLMMMIAEKNVTTFTIKVWHFFMSHNQQDKRVALLAKNMYLDVI